MKKVLIISGIIITVIVLFFILYPSNNDKQLLSESQIKETSNFDKFNVDLEFEDYNGNTVSLSDFSGIPLVINSWVAWCPFCKKELVDFAEAQKEFDGRVVIIAIDRAESLSVSKKYSDELGVTDDLIFLLDFKDAFYQSIGGFSMPETLFIDGEGNIRLHRRGPMDIEEIRKNIQDIL